MLTLWQFSGLPPSSAIHIGQENILGLVLAALDSIRVVQVS